MAKRSGYSRVYFAARRSLREGYSGNIATTFNPEETGTPDGVNGRRYTGNVPAGGTEAPGPGQTIVKVPGIFIPVPNGISKANITKMIGMTENEQRDYVKQLQNKVTTKNPITAPLNFAARTYGIATSVLDHDYRTVISNEPDSLKQVSTNSLNALLNSNTLDDTRKSYVTAELNTRRALNQSMSRAITSGIGPVATALAANRVISQKRTDYGMAPHNGGDITAFSNTVELAANNSHLDRFSESGNQFLKALVTDQRMDAPMSVVDNASYQKLAATDQFIPLYRGATASGNSKAQNFHEQLQSGDYYAGYGVFGQGTYSSSARSEAEGYAQSGINGSNGAVMQMLLPRSAKIATLSQLTTEMDNYRATALPALNTAKQNAVNAAGTPQEKNRQAAHYDNLINAATEIGNDQGFYAAYRGYDAYHVDKNQQTQWVILNRGIVVSNEKIDEK